MTTSILIIDDSVCVRKILEITLRRAGYQTTSFADGCDALRWLGSEEAHIPALIILDLTLPKMDGYSVLRCLKKRRATAQTPVVILSGRTGVIDHLKGRLAGASVYLTKPFRQQTILEVVRMHLASSEEHVSHDTESMGRRQAAVAVPRAAFRPFILHRMEVTG